MIEHGEPSDVALIVDEYSNDNEYPYPTDGAVIRVNEMETYDSIGHTSKFPKWMCAFKCTTEKAITQLTDVVYQVGRSGNISPVAILEPVRLAGTTVSRASLHNMDYIREKDLYIGDYVEIEKSGEIIPQVLKAMKELRATGARHSGKSLKKIVAQQHVLNVDLCWNNMDLDWFVLVITVRLRYLNRSFTLVQKMLWIFKT